jgi:hypothetical protein
MRMKTIHAIRVAIQTVDRVLNANLPMANIWANASAVTTHKQTR